MKTEHFGKLVLAVVESGLLIAERLLGLFRSLKLFRQKPLPFSYENLLLDFCLDLKDADGRRATIVRKQKVRFSTSEAGVLECPVWGDGSQLQRYLVQGATRLGTRNDGSRQIVLLGLRRRAEEDTVAQVVSRQTLGNSFLKKEEWFEAIVQRPTRRLSLRAVFPKGRPPLGAYIEMNSAQSESLPVKIGKDGRARIMWSGKGPTLNSVYSLRWAW